MGLAILFGPWWGLGRRQRQVLRQGRLAGAYTAAAWVRLLAPLAGYDARAARYRWVTGVLLALSLVPILVSLSVPALWPAALGLTLPLAALFHAARPRGLDGRLGGLVLPLVRLLGADARRDTPLRLTADLRGPLLKGKRVRTTSATRIGRYRQVETHYLDPWLHLGLPLADGARLDLTLRERVRERRRTRRNARGRLKTKHKYRAQLLARVRLRLPATRWRPARPPGDPAGRLQVSQQIDARWLTLRARQVLAHKGPDLPPPRLLPLLDLLAGLYAGAETTPEGAPPRGKRHA
jgi:hypothetical protein